MRQWDKVKHLSSESRDQVYNFYIQKEINYEIREYLATWIENNILPSNLSTGFPEHAERICQLCAELFAEIERMAQNSASINHDFILQMRLREYSTNLQRLSPLDLYQRIKDCLMEEARLLELESAATTQEAGVASEIYQELCYILNLRNGYLHQVENLEDMRAKLNQAEEQRNGTQLNLNHLLNGVVVNGEQYIGQYMDKLANENAYIEDYIPNVLQQELNCLALVEELVCKLQETVSKLEENFLKLIQWSEMPVDTSVSTEYLYPVEHWCTQIIEIISSLSPAHVPNHAVLQSLQSLIVTVLRSSLAISVQPPQVIKKDTAFSFSVKFLGGQRFVPQSPVMTLVLKEAQSADIFEKMSKWQANDGCGKIVNNTAIRLCNQAGAAGVDYQFKDVAISDVRPKEKNADCRAMREKYCLVAFTNILIGDTPIWVGCCSVPFVYIVHTSQTVEGLLTIFWDRYFRQPGRRPFVVPEVVAWSQMGPALNNFFKMMTNSERDFTETNLRNLAEHIFQTKNFSDSSMISLDRFLEKDGVSLKGKWGWFYSCAELTTKYLTPYLQNGYVVGFINRDEAEEIIATQTPGSFILRFSNTVEGGISITTLRHSENSLPTPATSQTTGLYVESSLPFTHEFLKDLKVNLSHLIRTYPFYENVYHQSANNTGTFTSKHIAFAPSNDSDTSGSRDRAITSKNKKPYVRMVLIMRAMTTPGASLPGPSRAVGSTPLQRNRTPDPAVADTVGREEEELMEFVAHIERLGLSNSMEHLIANISSNNS